MSPLVSTLGAGSSHAMGDERVPRIASEVAPSIQRVTGRYTTGFTSPGTNISLGQTPVAGNVLVVFTSSNVAAATPTVTYGGSTLTVATSTSGTGIQGYLHYIVVTQAMVNSGGTTATITYSATNTPTAAGYATMELKGVASTSSVDQSKSTTGSTGGAPIGACAFIATGDTMHTYKGGIGIAFATCAGAQTFASMGGLPDTTYTAAGATGSFAASCNVCTVAMDSALTFTNVSPQGVGFATTGATSRVYVTCYAYFRPAA